MVRQIKQIAVDSNFFKNLFEKERKSLAKQIGVNNISQSNFTKMITGFKMRPLKKVKGELIHVKKRSKKR